MIRRLSLCAVVLVAACASLPGISSPVFDGPPPDVSERALIPAAVQANPDLGAREILASAHDAAGGDDWRDVKSLYLEGYNIIRRPDGSEVLWDRYAMWREFSGTKANAHAAEGKVRIEAWSGDVLAMLIAFDGATTYDQNGPVPEEIAARAWASNFGFGAIRNALDEGWMQSRLPDDLIDNEPAYMIELTDPSGSKTRFGIRQSDFATVYAGFSTPRGWHERRYSHFFAVPGSRWVQPGRVRLSYDGVKANEAIWTKIIIGSPAHPSVFVVTEAPDGPTF
ncbi:MAG: hypothetical protein ACK46Q_09200 [Hyphomonas sp.]